MIPDSCREYFALNIVPTLHIGMDAENKELLGWNGKFNWKKKKKSPLPPENYLEVASEGYQLVPG